MRALTLLALLGAVVVVGACFDGATRTVEGALTCSSDDDCAASAGVCLSGRCFAAGTPAAAITGPGLVELIEDQATRFTVAVSGIDPATVRLDVITPPARGSLVALGGAELLYVPAPDDHGTFVAELVASDGGVRETPPAVVEIVVLPAPDPALVVVEEIFTDEDVRVTTSAAIIDPDNRDCSIVIVDPGVLGAVAVEEEALVYTPADDANGLDRVVVAAGCDGTLDPGSLTTVDVTIVPVDDAPIALPLPAAAVRLLEDTILPIALPFSEVDGDDVCFTVASPPAHGTLDLSALSAGLVVYVPDIDFSGTDTFTFSVGDADGDCVAPSSQEVTLQIDAVDDPPQIGETIIQVDAIGPGQRVPVELVFPDGDHHNARLTVQLEANNDLFRSVEVDGAGRSLIVSPLPHLVIRGGLLTVGVIDDRGLSSTARLEVVVNGMASCGHAHLADPAHPSGVTLLERRRRSCTAEPCSETFVSFCEQTRRGGGFELLVKVPGSGSELRRNALAWTDRLLNEQNPVPDGGVGVLRGARDLPLDDLLIFRAGEGFTPGAALDVAFAVDVDAENATLQERLRAAPSDAPIASWDRSETEGILPLQSDTLTTLICRADETAFVRREVTLNHPLARIGGERISGCRDNATGFERGRSAAPMGIGLETASGRGARLVFGRSRDFRSIVGEDCAALAGRFGGAFIPGIYTTTRDGVVVCGDVDADRGCNDGAIGPGVEACDDGDDLVGNGCSPDCALVFCGDGVVTAPYETCEPGPGEIGLCEDNCGTGDPSTIP